MSTPSFMDFLFGGGGLEGLAGTGLLMGAYDNLGDIGQDAMNYAEQMGETAMQNTSFRPYSVTTSTGSGFTAGPNGNYQVNLSGSDQAIMDKLQGSAMSAFSGVPTGSAELANAGLSMIQNSGFGGNGGMPTSNPSMVDSSNALINQGMNMMGGDNQYSNALSNYGSGMLNYQGAGVQGAGAMNNAMNQSYGTSSNFQNQLNQYDTVGREQAVYDRMQAAMAPQRERDALELENRLAAQGRLGVATNQYGGTPEQLAQAKAFAEADNNAMLGAMGQAQSELMNLANIGNMYGGLGNQTSQVYNNATQANAANALQGQQLGMQAQNMAGNLQNAFANTGINAIGAGQAGLFNNAQMGQIANNMNLANFNAGQNALLNNLAMQGAQQDLGIGALQASYLPQAQMLNALAPGMTAAGQAQQAQMYGAGLQNEAMASGIEALLGSAQGQANLMGTIGSGLLSGANNAGGAGGSWLDMFADWLGG